jgi:hypothetical protein
MIAMNRLRKISMTTMTNAKKIGIAAKLLPHPTGYFPLSRYS